MNIKEIDEASFDIAICDASLRYMFFLRWRYDVADYIRYVTSWHCVNSLYVKCFIFLWRHDAILHLIDPRGLLYLTVE